MIYFFTQVHKDRNQMIQKFNFLISCPRLHERDACAEIWYFFSFIGDEEAKCRKSKNTLIHKCYLNYLTYVLSQN